MRKTRNHRPFWYCLYKSDRKPGDTSVAGEAIPGISVVGDDEKNINYVIDENGNETGERILQYADEVQMNANISPASGQSQAEMFGGLEDYDKVIVTTDMSCQIDENSVLFLDKDPEWSEVKTYEIEETDSEALYADNTLVEKTYRVPVYDYIVKRVAKGLNSISIAVRKVKVR